MTQQIIAQHAPPKTMGPKNDAILERHAVRTGGAVKVAVADGLHDVVLQFRGCVLLKGKHRFLTLYLVAQLFF